MNKDLLHSKVELFETGGEISYREMQTWQNFFLVESEQETLQ